MDSLTPEQKEQADTMLAPPGIPLPRWLTRALSDPGAVVTRARLETEGGIEYEYLPHWQARAVMASMALVDMKVIDQSERISP